MKKAIPNTHQLEIEDHLFAIMVKDSGTEKTAEGDPHPLRTTGIGGFSVQMPPMCCSR